MITINCELDIIKAKKIILLLGDIICLAASFPAALFLVFTNELNREVFFAHLLPFAIIYFVILTFSYITGLYDTRLFKSTTALFSSLITVYAAGMVFGMLFFYLTSGIWGITPKTNLAFGIFMGAAFVGVWRALFQRFLSKRMTINVAIAGLNEHARELAGIIRLRTHMGYKLTAAIITDSLFNNPNLILGETIQTFPADKNLIKKLIAAKIDTVITAENPHLNPKIAQTFYECIPHKIRFLDLAQSYELLTGSIPVSYINQTWFLENINEQKKALYDKIKRLFDIFAAGLILLFSMPLWPLIAFAIKWESGGAVLYTQERVGQNRKLFRLIKFRSMIKNAERGKAIWAAEQDPRVTKVGALLRRLHLDELPQMINILKGDLSLVGPRPERTEFVRELETQIPHYHIRHIIKPGFTGWAQVNFRYARTPMDTYEKFQYDLYYLKNRSLLLDAAILLKTTSLFFKRP